MKRMAGGTAATLAFAGLAACFSNPALDLNTDNFHIVQPTPLVAFTKVGDSVQLRLRLVNDANNGTITSFVLAGVPAGISVRYDDQFRPYYFGGADTLSVQVDKDIQQYYIKGLAVGKYTFTATATANASAPAATITVTVEAKTIAINKYTGLLAGDTVTLTAPTGSVFSQTSAVSFASAGVIGIASRSADSTQIKVVVGPGAGGLATVTKVATVANPAVGVASVTSDQAINSIPGLGNALSPTTGVVAGSILTITAPPRMVFSQTSAVTFSTGPSVITSRSADSTRITVAVGPGVSGAATVTKVGVPQGLVLGTFSLATGNSLLAIPNILIVPTTVSTTTPAFGAPMTVTLGGGLRFLGTSTVSIGGRAGYVLSTSADSLTATVVPFGGSTGLITFTNVGLPFTGGVFSLAPSGDKNVTVGAVTVDPNAGSPATASLFALPAVGSTVVLSDGGPYTPGGICDGDGCRYYKIVLAAPLKVDFDYRWNPSNTADMGLYLQSPTGSYLTIADAAGNQAGGPETKTGYTLPAGTSYLIAVWYNYSPGTGAPSFFHIKMTGKP